MLLPANTNVEKLSATVARAFRENNQLSQTCAIKIQKIFFQNRLKFIGVYFGPLVQTEIKLNEELDFIY